MPQSRLSNMQKHRIVRLSRSSVDNDMMPTARRALRTPTACLHVCHFYSRNVYECAVVWRVASAAAV